MSSKESVMILTSLLAEMGKAVPDAALVADFRAMYDAAKRAEGGGGSASPGVGGGMASPAAGTGSDQRLGEFVRTNDVAIITRDGLKIVVGDRVGLQDRVDRRIFSLRVMGLTRTRDLYGWELKGDTAFCIAALLAWVRMVNTDQEVPPEWAGIRSFGPFMEFEAWKDVDKFGRFMNGEWDEQKPYLLSVADFGPKEENFKPGDLTTDSQAWRSAMIRAMDGLSEAVVAVFGCRPLSHCLSFEMIKAKLRTMECKGIAHAFVFFEVNAGISRTMTLLRTGRARSDDPNHSLVGPAAFEREMEVYLDKAYQRIPDRRMPTSDVTEFVVKEHAKVQWVAPGKIIKAPLDPVEEDEEVGKKRSKRSRGAVAKRKVAPRVAGAGGPGGRNQGGPQGLAAAAAGICGFHLLGLLGADDKKTGVRFACKLKADGTCLQDKDHPRSLKAITLKEARDCVGALPARLVTVGMAELTKIRPAAFKP